MRQHTVETSDGGHLRVSSFGDGPGVVLVCGTNTVAPTYYRTARRLSTSLPVHVYDRRGRPGSSLQPHDYSMHTEVADLGRVLDATGSTMVFGHSYGGAVALEAGLQLPVGRIAVYDAVPNIGGAVPTHFLPEFESAVQRGDVHRAVSILGKGISAKLNTSPLPEPAFQAVVRLLAIATRKGRAWKGTVHSAVNELTLLDGHRPSAERYAGIPVPVLVLFGSRSDEFYRVIAQALSAELLHGRCTAVPGADHGALDTAPRMLISHLSEFFAQGQ
jgi:pimeloyl-ACP methyl ester carboxylesterase